MLDVGCGDGSLTISVSNNFNDVFAIDVQETYLARMRERVGGDPRFKVYNMSASELRFPNEFFDLITCIESIEHINDLERAAVEFARVLRHQGELIITCPNRFFPFENHGIRVLGREYHVRIPLLPYFPALHNRLSLARVFTPSSLDRIFRPHGLVRSELTYSWPTFEHGGNPLQPFLKPLYDVMRFMENSPLRFFGSSIIIKYKKPTQQSQNGQSAGAVRSRAGDSESLTIPVLGIPLFSRGLTAAAAEVLDVCLSSAKKGNRLISATSAHGLVEARKDHRFALLLNQFYLNLPDGMPLVWVGRMKGARNMTRCYGPDFFKEVMIRSAGKSIRHFLCGGKEGVASKLADVCAAEYGNHNCVGAYSPPFSGWKEEDFIHLASKINRSASDIVWIGLSTPKQERFAASLAKHLNAHFIVTVGAAFDFHTGKIRQAPRVLQTLGLEWLFRLAMEPRRLFKRYLEIVPMFLLYSIKDILTTKNR